MPEPKPAQRQPGDSFFVQKDGEAYMVDGKPVLVKLSQRKAGGPWWYSFRKSGRRVFESSGKHDLGEARAEAEAVALGPLPEKSAQVRRLKYAQGSANKAFHVPGEKKPVRVALTRRKAGGPWWFSFWWKNRKVTRSSGEFSEPNARAKARAAVAALMPQETGTDDATEGRRLALARDRWLESAEGKSCAAGTASEQYLKNRLERAFVAGWKAAREG